MTGVLSAMNSAMIGGSLRSRLGLDRGQEDIRRRFRKEIELAVNRPPASRIGTVKKRMDDRRNRLPDGGYGVLRADYAERIGRQWSAIGIEHRRPVRARQRLSSGLARPKSLVGARGIGPAVDRLKAGC